jgi:hypothetical protein
MLRGEAKDVTILLKQLNTETFWKKYLKSLLRSNIGHIIASNCFFYF